MERAKILSAFERGEFPLLLATDIAARGLDIDDLPYVIHADIPNEDGYIHRSGRTGRARVRGNRTQPCHADGRIQIEKMAKSLGIELKEAVYSGGKLSEK